MSNEHGLPAWMLPGGEGYTGTLFALAPVEYQGLDWAVYFINGRFIGAPKLQPNDNLTKYYYFWLENHVDDTTRKDETPIIAFLKSVLDGTALQLSPETPRPGGQLPPAGGLFGSAESAKEHPEIPYGPSPGKPYGLFGQIRTLAECEEFYAANPGAVRPPDYPTN